MKKIIFWVIVVLVISAATKLAGFSPADMRDTKTTANAHGKTFGMILPEQAKKQLSS